LTNEHWTRVGYIVHII